MKTEMLDALILDRALGELPPETAALLDAYLAQNPDAAARAAKLNDTLGVARASLAVSRETPRPLNLAALHREQRSVNRTRNRLQILELAACLAIGLTAGWMLRSANPSTQSVTPITLVHPLRHPEPATQFWSLSRFAPEANQQITEKKL